jgi:hypothetical protein
VQEGEQQQVLPDWPCAGSNQNQTPSGREGTQTRAWPSRAAPQHPRRHPPQGALAPHRANPHSGSCNKTRSTTYTQHNITQRPKSKDTNKKNLYAARGTRHAARIPCKKQCEITHTATRTQQHWRANQQHQQHTQSNTCNATRTQQYVRNSSTCAEQHSQQHVPTSTFTSNKHTAIHTKQHIHNSNTYALATRAQPTRT